MRKYIESKYIPMSETAYYILLSLVNERHGYGILNHVKQITNQRITLGAGTIYGTLKKLEKDGLIQSLHEVDRRKTYRITNIGMSLLQSEVARLNELVSHGMEVLYSD